MKLTTFVILIFVLSFNLNAQRVNYDSYKDIIKKNDYINKSLGITFTFSNDWKIYEKYNKMPDFIKPAAQQFKNLGSELILFGITYDNLAFMRASVEELSDELEFDLDKYYDALIKFFGKSVLSYTESSKITINDIDILIWDYEIAYGGEIIKFHEYIIKKDNYFIRFGFWTLLTMFDKSIPMFDKIMNTIRFEN
jgi:hypothetical protein